jgi:hypothetical protein
MTQDTCSDGLVSRLTPGISHHDYLEACLELPALRCADSARMRGEPLQASAVRYRRFLLLELPGPWGKSPLDGSRLESGFIQPLAETAAAADIHIVLIRRPGRRPPAGSDAGPSAMVWAIADTTPGAERIQWGSWAQPADLLDLNLTAALPDTVSASGPQRVALVCTNGKRDQCCAIRGRPVAAAVAAGTDWDTWECSHLGGHRFAATLLLLPSGDMFGWLDPESAPEVLQRFDAGQIALSHYRGRCGQPLPVQAALHDTAVRLGDFRRDAVQASAVRPGAGTGWPGLPAAADDLWEVEVTHRAAGGPEAVYCVAMVRTRHAPTLLSCADDEPKAEIRYETVSFTRVR